jgi:glutathione synthase
VRTIHLPCSLAFPTQLVPSHLNNQKETGIMIPPFPPTLTQLQLEALRDLGVDWALSHGLSIRAIKEAIPKPTILKDAVIHAPLALFPSPFPRSCYEQAYALGPMFNLMIHRITQDRAFLSQVMERYFS